MENQTTKNTVKRKVRILRRLPGVYPKYQPKVGEVYDADYRIGNQYDSRHSFKVCVIKVLDKFICLKSGEYEILEEE